MNVLALDTAGPIPAVAALARERIVVERLPGDRRASEELLPAVERALAGVGLRLADCRRIAVASGPGSFTGLRVGLATAWAFGRALGIPVEEVSTLEALAEGARDWGAARVFAVLDAGRGELIGQLYDLAPERAQALGDATRIPAADVARFAAGAALAALPESLAGPAGRAPAATLAEVLARAAARAPRPASSGRPAAIYSRASAAEEKHGSA